MKLKEDKMGYTKTFEATFVRVKHKIDFRLGTRVVDLMEYLKYIPPEATVDEVIEDTGDGKTSTIEFHEERKGTKSE